MKNLKKVLALVLAFACAFTMFAGALTFSDVKPGDDYSAAITMLSDLEVISGDGKGNYNPTGTITRAEACVLIANMMNGGKADTARFAGGSNFSDVPKTYWGESAIAYCVQNGVTYGVGGGKFAPTRQITDAEFVAMVTRAMGYDTAANPLSFPYGNYTAAVNNGIVDNVPYVEGSPCTRGEAAQIIYDCLFADYARYTANQNVIHNSDDHMASTLIEVVFGLDRAANADDDKCTQHYWVILGESCEDEDVIFAAPITDKKGEADYSAKAIAEFDCEADVSALIGRKVVLWGENTHANSTKSWEVDTVKAVETVDGQKAYDYNPTMDWEDDLDLDEVKTAYLKGVASKDIEDTIEKKNGNSYVLFDWDDDKEIDFISVTERYYATVDTLTSKKVIIDDIDSKAPYTLDLADGEYTFDCTELPEGYCCDKAVKHDYEVVLDKNVEEGDVVEITVEDTFDQTLVITINKVDSETKELTKIDSKGKVYFDDEKMEQADSRYINNDVNKLAKSDVDTDYDVWTNANGYIIKIDEASDSNDGYFLVLGVEDGEKKSIDSRSVKASMEVMFTDGKTAELDVAFDADGGALKDYYNDKDYTFDDYDDANGQWIVGGVFEYKLNDDGEIEKIIEVEDEISTEYEYDEKYAELNYNSALTNKKNNTVKFTGKDFVFVVDKDYVEATSQTKKAQDTLSVDKDLVVCMTIDELKDIDKADTAVASEGRYDGLAGAIAGLDDKDQDASKDYADGALLVVDDIDDYTGTKSHVVGAVTDVSVNSKGVYTFEMNEDETYSTGKTDKDKTLFQDGFKISENDDKIIETIASGKDNVKTYGYVLYADLTIRNDEVVAVALLVKDNDASEKVNMVPKTNDDFKGAKVDSDYRVERGIIDRVLEDDEVRIIRGAIAASDETVYTIDEYMDTDKVAYELNDDTVVFATNEIPGLVAEKALNGHIAYDKDFEITKDGKLEESIFNSKTGTDTYYVVDLIVDVDDDDKPVVAAYTFDDVEDEIGAPSITIDYGTKAAPKTVISDKYVALTDGGNNWSEIYWTELFADADTLTVTDAAGNDATSMFAIDYKDDLAKNTISFKASDTVNAGTYTFTISDSETKAKASVKVEVARIKVPCAAVYNNIAVTIAVAPGYEAYLADPEFDVADIVITAKMNDGSSVNVPGMPQKSDASHIVSTFNEKIDAQNIASITVQLPVAGNYESAPIAAENMGNIVPQA